ncbi:hypothetical protein MMC18_003625 [Xylographa bjoerkii]|nr:hypothetical protein [Xylographa bjoerkii]
MSESDISSLSSAPSIDSDDELIANPARSGTLDKYFKNGACSTSVTSPPPKRKRPVSPPHDYVLADNPDIAFIVMFRSRFSSAFPKSLPHYGPQDIERGLCDSTPDEHVERLLCALIGLVLNRKKDVESDAFFGGRRRGHFQRALEEAISAHYNQWPSAWSSKNPLHGGNNFNNMSPEQRLTLLKTMILWSLNSSDAIQSILKESYKQQRHDDDLNQPLSVQAWGRDGDKRRYWLIEGQDDTHFRLYRESNPALKHNTWRSVAGSIDELKIVADRLGEEGTQAARRLQDRITLAVPRFEASEEKRKRRDYRNARKAQFTRPDPGFSLYEGRTRGKRMKYTYSDEEEGGSDALSSRRSNRQSGISTPAEPVGPTFTASGRQVKSRVGGTYGETMLSGSHNLDHTDSIEVGDGVHEAYEEPITRTRTRGVAQHPQSSRQRKHIDGYNALDEMEDESDATSSGGEWDGGDDDEVEENIADDEEDEDVDMSDSGPSGDEREGASTDKHSLVVSLRYHKKHGSSGVVNEMKQEDRLETNGFLVAPTKTTTEPNLGMDPFVNGSKQLPNGYRPSPLRDVSAVETVTLQSNPPSELSESVPTQPQPHGVGIATSTMVLDAGHA